MSESSKPRDSQFDSFPHHVPGYDHSGGQTLLQDDFAHLQYLNVRYRERRMTATGRQRSIGKKYEGPQPVFNGTSNDVARTIGY